MSEFYDLLNNQFGDDDDLNDIRVTVRRCWFYDFNGYPVRIWQGKGKLFTSDGNEWLGSIDANNVDHHRVPSITDGRDGSSATYTFSLDIVDLPGQTIQQTYDAIRAEQWRTNGRKLTCYLVAWIDAIEGLRPSTPIVHFKDLTMMNTKFSEKLETQGGIIVKKYVPSVICKDGNFGRSNIPGGTYADAIQRQRASELGVSVDKGCEFLAILANRTFQLP
jgi:hypothetical protein